MAVKHGSPGLISTVARALGYITALLLISCTNNPGKNDMVVLTGATMSTTYSIKVTGLQSHHRVKEIQKEIESLLVEINQATSTFVPESDVSRFNRYNGTSPFTVSLMVYDIVKEALRVSQMTMGAFDITVAPLVNLWGFGVDNKPSSVPDESRIIALLKRTGYQKIEVSDSNSVIRKRLTGVTIDLSAIAKGYAVDRVSELLEDKGVSGYLVEIGGEIRTFGFKTGQNPWIVGIEKPAVGERSIQQVVSMGNNAMATSGDYRNYFEENGKRYSHLINPATGKPIRHRLASVSIIHPSCMTADAVATAFMVLGPEKAYRIALREDLAAYFLVRTRSGFDVRATPAFKAFLTKD